MTDSVSEMEREDLSHRRRSSYWSSCMVSPSCFPVHEEIEYSRIHYCGSNKRGRRWRNFLRRLVRDGKSMYGSKHLSFHYDAVSYSQNFDEGCHYEESGRCPPVFRDVRWDHLHK
ncbi:DNA polymerase zeta catalytic subunit like [Melia azedarach]|nr:DNA polymerase zeta catalytic subunit like [Melia azedarach]